jgi:hypothetical protein
VVSISTTRLIPSALGFAHAAFAGAGADAGAACGVAAPLGAGVCDQAAPEAHNEIALAKINPATIRILFPSHAVPALSPGFLPLPEYFLPRAILD